MSPIDPQHYRNPAGVQIIELIRHLPFSLGNAVKYVYRHEGKENAVQDLTKALWYLRDFLEHPTRAESVSEITPDLIAAVLEGVSPFETRGVLVLLDVARSSLSSEKILRAEGSLAETLLQQRLALHRAS